jgi:hypothetical protein
MGKEKRLKGYHFIIIFLVIVFLVGQIDLNEDSKILNEKNITDLERIGENNVKTIEDSFENISKLHWGHTPITYMFENKETERQTNLIRLAFKKIEEETSGIVKFKEVVENPDILINFKPQRSSGDGDHPVADALITERDYLNNLIIKGELNFYGQGFACNTGYPELEVHEILHLFDIPHNPLTNSVMSPYTAESSAGCKVTKIDEEYISCLKYIYSNGRINGSCDFPNIIHKKESQEEMVCDEGWYPVEGTNLCCPEPNMVIIGEYCESRE